MLLGLTITLCSSLCLSQFLKGCSSQNNLILLGRGRILFFFHDTIYFTRMEKNSLLLETFVAIEFEISFNSTFDATPTLII